MTLPFREFTLWRERLGLFSLGVPRDAVREDQEGRSPEANEDPEEFAMSTDLKTRILAAGIIPDGDRCED